MCELVKPHKKTPLVRFLLPDERFSTIHMDIVGPLPPSRGASYLLTCTDRFTRWVEALPMNNQTAETVATTFIAGWVADFGTPLTIVTDQGRNFKSNLFRQVADILGIELRQTTSYHPQANGLIERQHRTIKAALMARSSQPENWMEELPAVLLGLRNSFREELGASPAELVYGTALRLPGEFFERATTTEANPIEYVQRLHAIFDNLRPSPTSWHISEKTFSHPELDYCSHVFLRNDTVRTSLQRPYTGPHKVVKRSAKTFDILIGTRRVKVSRDRLKPAFVTQEENPEYRTAPPPASTAAPPSPSPPGVPEQIQQGQTRSGRRVRFPAKLRDFVV
ncbi:Hypothetical protein NTJ_10971 [Nesidiocoris tenuis]|uniref:Integrase catalytic domain-containing protein n=1 Tax=Nesidiocoris tenuis TaxID=355587 RepID=A0ABN7B155_9HEMI|nr:Hypothetical protein NTJ_10971 [Nesidiocoris tenuis]